MSLKFWAMRRVNILAPLGSTSGTQGAVQVVVEMPMGEHVLFVLRAR